MNREYEGERRGHRASDHFEFWRNSIDRRFWSVSASIELDLCYGPLALDGKAVVDDFGNLRMVTGDVARERRRWA